MEMFIQLKNSTNFAIKLKKKLSSIKKMKGKMYLFSYFKFNRNLFDDSLLVEKWHNAVKNWNYRRIFDIQTKTDRKVVAFIV